MSGGINAWNGLVAEGAEDEGFGYFPSEAPAHVLTALAWAMEEGARLFYEKAARKAGSGKYAELFGSLVKAEVQHKATLSDVYKRLVPEQRETLESFAASNGLDGGIMEGGRPLSSAIDFLEGADLRDLLEYSVAFEANSYDLYLRMERRMRKERSGDVFRTIAMEEKSHLDRLSSYLDEMLDES